ncbi:hypothetical protein H6802_02015 [Candidatus Nomurabacteria bacterium]|uniref:DNA polymerase III subunit delta n=1 Tax=candidate division WWE3 bacterium TaxID=2053526 RepID=A0A955E1P4_UNCKA|nr:hypothetical protein [candidate division WWE3 bacterium]MCB9823707.1 hypothetical protein [Candidatus Nomurabacteria bacterium]MCB9827214.1 hypothetical protein [Candidatus Nomurabacteria bacterium]MCB9827502.1 hypothetical protein [Candidatus Nomurabacteria bacterium]HXK52561.1 hypothetical protein [bacterium]
MEKGSHILQSSNYNASKTYLDNLLQDIYHTDPENNPDVLIISPKNNRNSIGIDQIRIANTYCTLRPHHYSYKTLIVRSAHKMTVQAQNAFLKTLEDMGVSMLIILETPAPEKLLQTVRSRCKLITLTNIDSELNNKQPKQPNTASGRHDLKQYMTIQQRLEWAEELSKEDADVILDVLTIIGNQLKERMEQKDLLCLEALLEITDAIQNTNVNKRFALEYFALTINS